MKKSISAIHPTITENMKNMLVKHTPHISMRESHNISILAMSNSSRHSKQGIEREVPHRSLCLVLKLFRVYCKSSPHTVVKKRMGDQRDTKVAP